MGQGGVKSLALSPVLGCLPALPHSLCPRQLNEAVINKTQRSRVKCKGRGWEHEHSVPPQFKPESPLFAWGWELLKRRNQLFSILLVWKPPQDRDEIS